MIKQRVIGGEFDIDISKLANNKPLFDNGVMYSSGRAALYNILKHIEERSSIKTILLPDYLCESVLDAVKKFSFKIIFYKITSNLELDTADFKEKYTNNSVVLIINYFGGINCASQISFIRTIDSKACIIEDNVQAFYAMHHQSDADYSFTSFRKCFPVADGAWVKSKHMDLPEAIERNTFADYKIAGGILKNISLFDEVEDADYLKLLRQGEEQINDNFSSSISPLTTNLMSAFDFRAIAEHRRANAEFLISGLEELNIEPILNFSDNASVPLFVPIRIENRNSMRSELFQNNVFCPVHWPVPACYDLERGKEMADKELSLIIDQRYSTDDMKIILSILKKFSN